MKKKIIGTISAVAIIVAMILYFANIINFTFALLSIALIRYLVIPFID